MEHEPDIRSAEQVEAMISSALEAGALEGGGDDAEQWDRQEGLVMDLWNIACDHDGEIAGAAIKGLGRMTRELESGGTQSLALDRLDRISKESADPELRRLATTEIRETLTG